MKKEINQKKKDYYKNNPEIYQRHLEICRKWYARNREKDLLKGYIWRMTHKDKLKETTALWREKNREKLRLKAKKDRFFNHKHYLSRSMANYQIEKKEFCEMCDSKEKLNLHHWNYDKPLNVNTLCITCHNIQHTKNFERWHESRLESDKLLEVVA